MRVCVTAGVGSDHIDLDAAVDHKIQVPEVSGSNVVSVAEHAMISILLLFRNLVPAHEMIERGEWQVSEIARNAFNLEGKVVGTPLPAAAAEAVNARRVEDLKEFVWQCDLVTINCPLHGGTRGLVNTELLKQFKKGVWIVNTARGAIRDKDAIAAALSSGHIM
ncbi:hypothetical protein NLJ89_g4100 [Agrocybe chaxingu]|uniref:D-isomer specific 2-hydroxyacid dehydrogenase NAD-binding domain-containing protein n=1 Tax=Agrocybe chaxingu TaxID=84603 RepID=A0A9W8K946_9AGAR|nr:hypothetical protein NLJ89_g4100 [Agrocybe chaxingu]